MTPTVYGSDQPQESSGSGSLNSVNRGRLKLCLRGRGKKRGHQHAESHDTFMMKQLET